MTLFARADLAKTGEITRLRRALDAVVQENQKLAEDVHRNRDLINEGRRANNIVVQNRKAAERLDRNLQQRLDIDARR